MSNNGLGETATELAAESRWLVRWFSNNSTELLTALGVGFGILLVLIGLRWLARRLLGGGKADGWRGVFEKTVARTRLYFLIPLAAKLASEQQDFPSRVSGLIDFIFTIAAALQVAIWARALVIGFIEQKVGAGENHRTLGTAMGLIRVLVTAAAFMIAGIVILDNLGVDVTGLVAGLGIGGIAIGLAAQGIFGDLFAALAIIFDRPFRKGDTINVGGGTAGFVGTVENIGLKTTRLRSLDGELVAFGNADLLKNRLHNYALLQRRRVLMHFGVRYETPPDLLDKIPDIVREVVEAQETTSFDRCHAYLFAASSIDFETVYFVDALDFETFASRRHAVMLGILRRFSEQGIGFAYPTQTTYTAGPDGELVMPWPPGLAAPGAQEKR
jgi:small-conductance mechanosensitive channel